MRRRKVRRGFTLIEVLLVVAIIAVFAALAIPRYSNAVHRYRADAAARRINADIAFAQSRARTAGASRSIVFNVGGSSYQIPSEKDLNRSLNTYTVNLAANPYYVSISTVNFSGGASITFNGYGVPDTSGSVQIRAGNVLRT